jgi:predicted ATPase
MSKIKSLAISGFKSIRRLDDFELRDLNVLIGANGAGKSNFVSFFPMLRVLVTNNFQSWTAKQGGANRVLSYGVKKSMRLESML